MSGRNRTKCWRAREATPDLPAAKSQPDGKPGAAAEPDFEKWAPTLVGLKPYEQKQIAT